MGDVKNDQEIEGDAKQLLNVGDKIRDEVEVCTYTIIIAANRRRDLLLQDPKPDAHTEQELPQTPSSAPPFEASELARQLPPAVDLITRPSSNTQSSTHLQDTNEDTKESTEQKPQNTSLTNLLSLHPP